MQKTKQTLLFYYFELQKTKKESKRKKINQKRGERLATQAGRVRDETKEGKAN